MNYAMEQAVISKFCEAVRNAMTLRRTPDILYTPDTPQMHASSLVCEDETGGRQFLEAIAALALVVILEDEL